MTGVWLIGLALAGEWRAAGGAQLETASHGLADLGYRSGAWSAQVQTDTLDLRYDRAFDRGKVVVGARAGAFGGGMWLTPYTAGAPDPDRVQFVSSAGPDLAAQRWLPGGAFLAAELSSRGQWFTPGPDATLEMGHRWWSRADAGFGWWLADGRRTLLVFGGADWTQGLESGVGSRVSPHAAVQATFTTEAALAPVAELRAGWAENADDVVATRLGGMTPYHVPLAGAGWAEFWVEDYTAARLGGTGRVGELTVPVLVDVAAWSRPTDTTSSDPRAGRALGLLTGARWARDTWFARAEVGWSPTIERPAGSWPLAVFVHAGTDWRR